MSTTGISGSVPKAKIVVACVQRNEMDRYLPNLLQGWATFADKIVILDDRSSEDQRERLEAALEALPIETTTVTSEASEALWGNESPLRQQLWQLALRESAEGDWIFILDADMIPLQNPTPILQLVADDVYEAFNAVAFPLYDLWHYNPLLYREDRFWQGHRHARVWVVRHLNDSSSSAWEWSKRGVHTGHIPTNYPVAAFIAPAHMAILHLAYMDEEDRTAKHRQYTDLADQLTAEEYAHADSIIDENPNLLPLPFGTDFGRWLRKAGTSGSADPSQEPS